ncbi:MAG: hypothetical protein HRT37_21890 [Alteromonadaceae bacterium]|nr:hypothetical protein [Alteromonadaceae bacterium]
MNLDDFKNTWEQQSGKIDAAVKINQTMLAKTRINKQIKELRSMKLARIIESIVFFLIIVSLWQFIVNDFSVSAPTVSAFILNIFAIVGLAGNIGQIVLISKVDYSKPINVLHKDIYAICSHKLQLTKLLLLSVPFYMAYVFLGFDVLFGVDLFKYLEQQMVMFYLVSSGLLLMLTIWLLSKLNYRNIATTWVKKVIQVIVGDRLIDIAQFINSMELAEQ